VSPLVAREGPRILRVLAPNPGPFTLEGTNTWIVGAEPSVVIDPGPDDPGHLEEVRRVAGSVSAILLTHHHEDHFPGAAALARATGAPILAFRPGSGEEELEDGRAVTAGGAELTAVHTPGHTSDHTVFLETASRSLFTGDAVLGRGTSVIDPPDGDLADYLRSLERMLALRARVIYPGHGPAVWAPEEKLVEYRDHRLQREREVLAALAAAADPAGPEDLVPAIYVDTPRSLHPIAARSVLAHLLKLEREGRVERVDDGRFALHGDRSTAVHERSAATE
jgi:glyoxylase-like metal-dependent hydrolase (beta-lactamase superfamily II)